MPNIGLVKFLRYDDSTGEFREIYSLTKIENDEGSEYLGKSTENPTGQEKNEESVGITLNDEDLLTIFALTYFDIIEKYGVGDESYNNKGELILRTSRQNN